MQYPGYDRDILLFALQAMVIYVFVQALDPANIIHNSVAGLVMTMGIRCSHPLGKNQPLTRYLRKWVQPSTGLATCRKVRLLEDPLVITNGYSTKVYEGG